VKRPDALRALAGGAAIVTIALTAAAFWLSYEHLHDVADGNGLDGARAWAWPGTVDLFIVAGELLILRAALRGRFDWFAYLLAGVGSLGSIALNVAGVGTEADPMEYVVAAVPPTAALVAFGALMRQVHEALERITASERPRHTICTGPTGLLFLRRPAPHKAAAPSEPAGPVGQRITDLAAILTRAHAPVVYFITNGSRVKIGTTINLRKRVSTLCLRVDDIALVLHGGQDFERSLHERFTEHRAGDTEWFELAGDLAAFVATGGASTAPAPVADPSPTVAAPVASETPAPVDSASTSERQNEPATSASDSAKKAANVAPAPRQRAPRSGASSKRNGRRSMTEWVDLAGPVFHAEFERLRRQPTGDEFAEAIKKARLGTVSASTAKNIRAEILDRAELPALD
jgi:hypothetical protein